MAARKGNRVELLTFKNWGKSNIIGYKTIEENEKTYVNFIWCKICAQYKKELQTRLKGSAKISAMAFVNGTNVVTKHQVDRHLQQGGTHEIALGLEMGKDKQDRISACRNVVSAPAQKRIDVMTNSTTREAYNKLFRTAYELAMNPTLPMSQFKTLVKVQKQNGVRLIDGHEEAKSGRMFISYIAKAVRGKVALTMSSAHFMSILTDGSQARKTGNDKEMVLVRTERNGSPVYFVASLLEMSLWGGTDAESLKKGIDSIFDNGGAIEMQSEEYRLKLVSCTSDGASVNFGHLSGLMVRLQETRPWMIKIHCANHRIELAVKNAFEKTDFAEVDKMYIGIYYLMKNSGKIKSEVKAAAQALNIKHYNLSKLTGTRFVGHRREAFKKLLAVWPALIAALENVIADGNTKSETRAKVTGYLRKLKSYNFLCMACCYLDVLELITPPSKIFESEGLMPYNLHPIIMESSSNLSDAIEADLEDEMLTSHLASFRINNGEVRSEFLKGDDTHQHNTNKEKIMLPLERMTNLNEGALESAIGKKKKVCEDLKNLLNEKFSDFKESVFQNMKWMDPANWDDDKKYGVDQIKNIYVDFKEPLDFAAYVERDALAEWKSFRNYVRINHRGSDASNLWPKVLQFKRQEYKNLCLIAELITSLSGSNSTVERAFSLLTLLLSDKRLSMKNDTMEDLMLININDKIWTNKEKEDIINSAVDAFMEKRRVKKTSEPPEKVLRSDFKVAKCSKEETEDICDDDSDNEIVISDLSSEDE